MSLMDSMESRTPRSRSRKTAGVITVTVATAGSIAASTFAAFGGATANLLVIPGEVPASVYWYPALIVAVGMAVTVYAWLTEAGFSGLRVGAVSAALIAGVPALVVTALIWAIYVLGMYRWQHPLIFLSAICLSVTPALLVSIPLIYLSRTSRDSRGMRVLIVAIMVAVTVCVGVAANFGGRLLITSLAT